MNSTVIKQAIESQQHKHMNAANNDGKVELETESKGLQLLVYTLPELATQQPIETYLAFI